MPSGAPDGLTRGLPPAPSPVPGRELSVQRGRRSRPAVRGRQRTIGPFVVCAVLAWLVALGAQAAVAAAPIGPSPAFGPVRVGESLTRTQLFSAEYPVMDAGEPFVAPPAIVGPAASEFSIVGDTCSGPAVRTTCQIDVAFRPASTGRKDATLRIQTAAGTSDVPVSGDGFVVGPRLAVEAPLVELVGRPGAPPSEGRVTIVNTGDVSAEVASVDLFGARPGSFLVVEDSCTGATLQANAGCAVGVRFVAATSDTAQLVATCRAACGPVAATVAGIWSPPQPGVVNLGSRVAWSLHVSSAVVTRSAVTVRIYTSLPARFAVRLAGPRGTVLRRRLVFGPGTRRIRLNRSRLRRGGRYTLEVSTSRPGQRQLARQVVRLPPR